MSFCGDEEGCPLGGRYSHSELAVTPLLCISLVLMCVPDLHIYISSEETGNARFLLNTRYVLLRRLP
jgi:hypothetical protein